MEFIDLVKDVGETQQDIFGIALIISRMECEQQGEKLGQFSYEFN